MLLNFDFYMLIPVFHFKLCVQIFLFFLNLFIDIIILSEKESHDNKITVTSSITI